MGGGAGDEISFGQTQEREKEKQELLSRMNVRMRMTCHIDG